MRVFCPCPGGLPVFNSLSAFVRNKIFNIHMIDYARRNNALDFLAINYYCKEYTQYRGLLGKECSHQSHAERKNYLGWNVYSQGLYEVLMALKRFNLPIVITENGTAETEDENYQEYLSQHLKAVARAYHQGVPLKGYFWWSLLDNFEWDKGFEPRFGLLEVDYSNMERKVRPFANTYAKICRENKIEI